jgi:hypothetical protein
MQWTMPPRVLQIVASLLVLAATASFVMGVLSAPQHGGRLPGEKVAGAAASGAAIDATDATPLADERIQGPPPPSANDQAKTEEKTAEADAGNSDDEDASAAAPAAAGNEAAPPKLTPPAPGNATPPQTLGGPPAADEPPH